MKLAQHYPECNQKPDVRLIIVPVANPDGKQNHSRFNLAGVDLNRNFPADNWHHRRHTGNAPLDQPESRAIFDLLDKYKPSLVISIHQPLGCIDYDGPAENIAAGISPIFGLPVRKLGGKPGSLGSYAGNTLGIPVITLELPREADHLSSEQLWKSYGNGLLTVLQ